MTGKIKNMNNNLLDIKVSLAGLGYFAISFADIDAAMKILTFILVSAFTIRRWYLMEKKEKYINGSR